MIAKNSALVADTSTQTGVFYPETDGMPLPDGNYQLEHFLDIQLLLKFFFKDYPDIAVSGNTFIYYVEGNPRLWVSPDCYVAFGVSVDLLMKNNTYRLWGMGKAPDFVLEIGSPSTSRNDLGNKRELYARLGIVEYWRFDPSGGEHYGEALVGERLVEGEYRELEMIRNVDGTMWAHSPTLNLDLHWEDGRLRFYDPVGGRWLKNMEETDMARELAEVRAESAEVRVESAEVRAESAEARSEMERTARESAEARLAEVEAELRRLRGG